jgi:hypothetical protein
MHLVSGVRNAGIRDGYLLELRRIEDVRDSAICLD